MKERQGGTPISGPVLSIQDEKFYDLHTDRPSDFAASKGWLNRFQHRHGISQVKITGEVRSAAEFSEAETKLRSMLDTDQDLDSYLDQSATLDNDAPVYHDQTDAEIIEEVQGGAAEESVEPEEPEESSDLQPVPSAAEAFTAFQTGVS